MAFSLRVLGAVLGFAANVVLARLLGATGAGVYYLALTVTTIATVVGRMGLDNAMLRFAGAAADQRDWPRLSGLYRTGIGIATAVSSVATGLVLLTAPLIAETLFGEPMLTRPLRVMCLSIVPLALVTLHGELLKGLRRVRDAMLVDSVAVPAVFIPLLLGLARPLGVLGATLAYTVSTSFVLLLGRRLWLHAAPDVRHVRGEFDVHLLVRTSLPMLWVASLYLVMGWTDTVMIGLFKSSDAVGLYNVAFRTAVLTKFILIAVNSVVAPRFAALHAAGERHALRLLARQSVRGIAIVAIPVLMLFVVIPGPILSVFGQAFIDASPALRILALGQFVSAASGSVGYLLMMCGEERALRNSVLLAALLNVCGNALLIPPLGITGAAAATASSLALQNLLNVYQVRRRLDIRIW